MQSTLLIAIAIAAFSVAIGAIAYWFASIPPEIAATLGLRGESRRRAMDNGGAFSMLEPLIRVLAGWLKKLPLDKYRVSSEELLLKAGFYCGMTPDEYFACLLLSTVVFGALGTVAGFYFDYLYLGIIGGCMAGFLLVSQQVKGEQKRRFKLVERHLPGEIDLASMCMSAGLDFPGALRLIISQSSLQGNVLQEELSRVLQELELGHTRKTALLNFESRVPTEAVREFVGAVVQAEEKGTPLAEILRIQATMLRMRRSVAAEEAASRAGVLMMIPLMMLLGSILIILMGSMLIETYQSGLFG